MLTFEEQCNWMERLGRQLKEDLRQMARDCGVTDPVEIERLTQTPVLSRRDEALLKRRLR